MEEFIPNSTFPVKAAMWRPRHLNSALTMLVELTRCEYELELDREALLINLYGETKYRVGNRQWIVLHHSGQIEILTEAEFTESYRPKE